MLLAAVPAAAGLVNDLSKLTGGLKNLIDPGAARDAARQARAQWMQQAAIAGSVLAARIIQSADANVAKDEQHFWDAAASSVQSGNPAVWQQAKASGTYWPTGQPFDMPNERAQILAQINSAPTVAMPKDGGPSGEVVTVTPGPGVSTAAQNAAHSQGLQLVPTTMIWLFVAAGVVFLVLRKK